MIRVALLFLLFLAIWVTLALVAAFFIGRAADIGEDEREAHGKPDCFYQHRQFHPPGV